MSRFTAEHRGEQFPEEWCVIDLEGGFSGFCIAYGVDEPTAEALADIANHLSVKIKKSKSLGA